MINPIEPELKGKCLLSITDDHGSHFTVNRTGKLAAGLVVSGSRGAAAIKLSRQERAALIATLIELQEEEDLP